MYGNTKSHPVIVNIPVKIQVNMNQSPKIKTEPSVEEIDPENALPTFTVKPASHLLDSTVEVIDLTEEEYLNEFKSFLNAIMDRTEEKDATMYATKTKTTSLNVQRTLPVPVNYLESIRFQQHTVICQLLNMHFKNAMLYGRITRQTVKDDLTVYELDDGTGRVNIFYKSRDKKYADTLTRLQYCEDILRRPISTFNEEAVPDSAELKNHLKLLILMAKAQCHKRLRDVSHLGTHCFVIGQPFMSRTGKVSLFGHTVFPDNEPGKSCELFWKTHLLSLYEPFFNTSEAVGNIHSSVENLMESITEKLGETLK